MNADITSRVIRMLESGETRKAIELAERESTGFRHPEAYSAWAHALMFVGSYERALAPASQAVELAPREPAFRFMRARILYSLGKYEGAAADCEEGLHGSSRVHNYYEESLALIGAAAYIKERELSRARALLTGVSDDAVVRINGEMISASTLGAFIRKPPAPRMR
jgi:tetratricopeptide (TPR) repeat protein